MARLTIIGGGFMGGALAEGLIDSGWNAPRTSFCLAEALISAAQKKGLTKEQAYGHRRHSRPGGLTQRRPQLGSGRSWQTRLDEIEPIGRNRGG
jgi:pyrroline-5-carboxylate reductase